MAMVRLHKSLSGDGRIEMMQSVEDSRLYKKLSACPSGVSIDIPTKKIKTTVLKRILLTVKGRRKEKDTPEECRPYLEEDYVQEKIIQTDFNRLVELPDGLDYDEWLATHTISFFEHINLMYGTLSEYCMATGCPSMSGPGNIQYLWIDEKGKKCKCAAPQYVDYVMTYTQKTIHDESLFPTKFGNVFPPLFSSLVKKILRLLYHVIGHIYHVHYKEVVLLKLHGHLNTLFLHFSTFTRHFSLIDEKETEMLDCLYDKLKLGVVSPVMTVSSGEHDHENNVAVPTGNGSLPTPVVDMEANCVISNHGNSKDSNGSNQLLTCNAKDDENKENVNEDQQGALVQPPPASQRQPSS